jgi:hypothetical protein
MDIIICLIIITLLTLIKGIARSDNYDIEKTRKLKPVKANSVGKEVAQVVNEMRNIEEEIAVLGEDIMSIINE